MRLFHSFKLFFSGLENGAGPSHPFDSRIPVAVQTRRPGRPRWPDRALFYCGGLDPARARHL